MAAVQRTPHTSKACRVDDGNSYPSGKVLYGRCKMKNAGPKRGSLRRARARPAGICTTWVFRRGRVLCWLLCQSSLFAGRR